MDLESASKQIDRLRRWRNYKGKDTTLKFLTEHVRKTYARPNTQLGRVAELWPRLVPPRLLGQTALVGLTRGVLTVRVSDSAVHYELDRLLRGGLEQQLKTQCKPGLHRIRVQVGPVA